MESVKGRVVFTCAFLVREDVQPFDAFVGLLKGEPINFDRICKDIDLFLVSFTPLILVPYILYKIPYQSISYNEIFDFLPIIFDKSSLLYFSIPYFHT